MSHTNDKVASGPSATILGQRFDASSNPVGAALINGDYTGFFNPGASQLSRNTDVMNKKNDPNKHFASNLRARIAREEWEDYKKRFQPIENKLIAMTNDQPGQIKQAQGEALKGINSGYDNAMPQIERQYARFGLQYSPDQANEIQRRLQLNKSLAVTQGLNMASRNTQDQLLAIASGGLVQSNKGLIDNQPRGS